MRLERLTPPPWPGLVVMPQTREELQSYESPRPSCCSGASNPVNTVPVELEASLEDVDYWTPEEVRQVVDRAARGDRSSLQLVRLYLT